MDEIAQLQADLGAQRNFNAETQRSLDALSGEVLDLRADRLLLRTVVAALWGQATPEFRGQIELLLHDPAKGLFSSPLPDDGARHLKERAKVFQDHLDQVTICNPA
jgi:hypothetical protein